MKKYLAVTAAFFVLSPAAFAADAIVYSDPIPTVSAIDTFTWTGGYVGAQAGYGWGRADNRLMFAPEIYLGQLYDVNGLFGGVYAGYNYQMNNNVVLGLDADINVAGLKGSSDLWRVYEAGDRSEEFEFIPTTTKMSWNGAARVRIGYAMDRILPYVAGGISFGGHQLRFGEASDGIVFKSTLTGWNVGAGIEYAATDKLILRGEYRYTDFGNRSFMIEDFVPVKVGIKTHDIRVGIAYKF